MGKRICQIAAKNVLTNGFSASGRDELEVVPRRVRRCVSDPVSERRRPVDDDLDLSRILRGQEREAGQAGVDETEMGQSKNKALIVQLPKQINLPLQTRVTRDNLTSKGHSQRHCHCHYN